MDVLVHSGGIQIILVGDLCLVDFCTKAVWPIFWKTVAHDLRHATKLLRFDGFPVLLS